MGEPKISAEARPKRLPLDLRSSDSGVHKLSHDAESASPHSHCPLADVEPVPPSSGPRLRSPKRAAAREENACALDAAMALAGVNDPEVAAEVDEAPQRVGKMRGKQLPVTADHLRLLAQSRDERLRGVFEYLVDDMRGRR